MKRRAKKRYNETAVLLEVKMEENRGISYKILDKDLPRPDVDWSEIYGKSFNSRIEKPTKYMFVKAKMEDS